MIRQIEHLIFAVILLLTTSCVVAGQRPSTEQAVAAEAKESAPGKSVDEEILRLAEQGHARWKAAPSSRERALVDFGKVVELADAERPTAETEKARHDRYRKMIRPGGGEPRDLNTRLVQMIEAIAKSRFHIAEAAFHRCQEIRLPPFKRQTSLPPAVRRWWRAKQGAEKAREWEQMLRFMPAQDRRHQLDSVQYQYWVRESFQDWRDRRDQARAHAEGLYLQVVKEGAPTWEAAAAARVGELHKTFALELEAAPVDPSIEADQELLEIYHGALKQAATPYRESAKRAYLHCLEVSRAHSLSNATSRACAADLASLEP